MPWAAISIAGVSGTGATDNGAGSDCGDGGGAHPEGAGPEADGGRSASCCGAGEEAGSVWARAGYVFQHFGGPEGGALPDPCAWPGWLCRRVTPAVPLTVDQGVGEAGRLLQPGQWHGQGARRVYAGQLSRIAPIFTHSGIAPLEDLGVTTITNRNTGGTDHLSFDAVGLPGFQYIQDPMDYETAPPHRTWIHTIVCMRATSNRRCDRGDLPLEHPAARGHDAAQAVPHPEDELEAGARAEGDLSERGTCNEVAARHNNKRRRHSVSAFVCSRRLSRYHYRKRLRGDGACLPVSVICTE